MLWGRSWLQGQDGGTLGKVVSLGRELAAGSFPALATAPGSVDGSGNKAVGPAALEWERGWGLRFYWPKVSKIAMALRHKHGWLEALGVGGL